MFKNFRVGILGLLAAVLFFSWLIMYLEHTQKTDANYWWQAGLSAYTVLGGIFGISVASHWSGLKSGVGRGIIFLSLGLISWGLGQAGWTYYTFKGIEDPTNQLVSLVYFISIPFWFYGVIQLSKATGSKFGWRSSRAKISILLSSVVLLALSYQMLVVVARGGFSSYDGSSFTDIFYDLGYAFGDVLLVTTALSIFTLSWKYLGGRFKVPIILVLVSFLLQYIADFAFSYVDGRGEYYNGHWCDVVYLAVMAVLSIAICMLNPSSVRKIKEARAKANGADQTISVVQPPSSAQATRGTV